MREVQDHYFRLAKEEGYLSRAAYKLIEIDDRRRILRKGDRVLDCGCAPGSWLQVASKRVGESGVVVGIDLKPIGRKIANNVVTVQGDFTQASPDELVALAGKPSRLFDVILADMAPSTSGDPVSDHFRSVRLCESAVDVCPALLRRGGNLVMKVFEGSAYMDLLRKTERLFTDAKGFKPKASRSESTEMYVIALAWRGLDPATAFTRPRDVNVLAPPRPAAPGVGWGSAGGESPPQADRPARLR
jgi:23S rRNA (uridine2552-2'-O)-methyltransferase